MIKDSQYNLQKVLKKILEKTIKKLLVQEIIIHMFNLVIKIAFLKSINLQLRKAKIL